MYTFSSLATFGIITLLAVIIFAILFVINEIGLILMGKANNSGSFIGTIIVMFTMIISPAAALAMTIINKGLVRKYINAILLWASIAISFMFGNEIYQLIISEIRNEFKNEIRWEIENYKNEISNLSQKIIYDDQFIIESDDK